MGPFFLQRRSSPDFEFLFAYFSPEGLFCRQLCNQHVEFAYEFT